MKLHALTTLILLTGATSTWSQTISDKAAKDEVVYRRDDDPAMQKALAKAASTLPEFLRLAANPRSGTSGYALKVGISDGRNTEYFWVNNFATAGATFIGTLNNEPRLVKKHKLGERVTFSENQIADWTYVDQVNKRVFGNFTACAILSKEPPDQAAAFKRQYGLQCEE
jgi:uncharacterized protein YegJ (DUF2314 family)